MHCSFGRFSGGGEEFNQHKAGDFCVFCTFLFQIVCLTNTCSIHVHGSHSEKHYNMYIISTFLFVTVSVILSFRLKERENKVKKISDEKKAAVTVKSKKGLVSLEFSLHCQSAFGYWGNALLIHVICG